MIRTEILGIELTLLGIVAIQLFEITNGVPAFFLAGALCVAAGTLCTLLAIASEE
mgnify:CR=1 FL=1